MSSRILSFSGGVASYSSHQSSIATSRPRFISCCRAVTYGVRTRRGLINTTSPPERPPSDNDKDATSSSPSDSLIKVTDIPAPHTGHIRVITLNSPRNKNAISRQLLGELEAEIQGIHNVIRDEVQAWQNKVPGAGIGQGTRAIVVGSEVDGVFCAGADLKERKDMTTEECVRPSMNPQSECLLCRCRPAELTRICPLLFYSCCLAVNFYPGPRTFWIVSAKCCA